MDECLLSVLVITFNQEKTISTTIDSIINQYHNYSFEIVICDDCSIDNTANILYKYMFLYPEIVKVFVQQKNVGLIENYFFGVQKCCGKYFMQCAGDDYWLAGKISTQLKYMESNPSCILCYSRSKVYNETKQKFEKFSIGSRVDSISSLLTENKIPAVTICIRRSTLLQYIDEVDPLTKNWLMEDYPIWLWVVGKGPIHFISDETSVYRISINSISNNKEIAKKICFERSVYDIRCFFSKLYNISISQWNEEKTYANEYIKYLKKHYDRESVYFVKSFLDKNIDKLGVKFKILKFVIQFKPLFYLYLFNFFIKKCIMSLFKFHVV